MAVFLKDFSTLKRELQTDISTILPQASQARNSALIDIFVNPNATQFSFLYRSIQQILDSTELNTVSGQDLDRYASNFGVTRKAGTPASGSVFFSLDNSFETGKDIEIPANSTVSAQASNGTVVFTTTSAQFLRREDREVYAAIAEANRAAFEQGGVSNVNYAVEVPISATIDGNRGLVGTYAITGGSINGVNDIINLAPTTGGFNAESDTALRQRVALVIAGNSVGTVAGVKSSALAVTGVVSAFVVTPGSSLMTRDGSVYDENGNLLQEGRGNTIDVYIFGQRLSDTIESYVFQEDTTTEQNIALSETIILGTAESETIRKQPVTEIGSIIGTESGGNFGLAVETEDEDGNIVLEGQVAFIRDFDADNYILVRNTTTSELAIARVLNPNSSKYAIVQSLVSSEESNSVKGQDRLIFLRKTARITREVVARGSELNGADSLKFSDVVTIGTVQEDVQVERELIEVTDDGAFQIQTRHTPVVQVNSVKHVRLGTTFNSTLENGNIGLISLVGRFAPQAGDLLEVSYIWRKTYLRAFEYFLREDSLSWVQPEYVIENDSLTIYNNALAPSMQAEYQPLTPTYLSCSLSNAVKRAVYDVSVVGDIADVYQEFASNYQAGAGESLGDSDAFVFDQNLFARGDALDSHIGRVTRVRNVTRGFDYNLIGYKLQSNRYAPEAGVNPELSRTEFSISEKTNLALLAPGDLLRFNAPESNANWSSTEELTNNIRGNIQPIYDDTLITINDELGEVQLVQPEENPNLAESVAEPLISADTTWSGKVRVDSDVVVDKDVTLTIEPGTVVSFVSSGDLPSVQEVKQRVRLVRTFEPLVNAPPPEDAKSLYYVFFNNIAPFFVVRSNDGTEDYAINYNTDLILKTKDGEGNTIYQVNGFDLDPKFWGSLQSAIEKNGTLVCAIVEEDIIEEGVQTGTVDVYQSYDIVRFGTQSYIVPLENDPRELSATVYDILLRATNNTNLVQTVQYEPTLGKYAVIPVDTATDLSWDLEYGVEVVSRIALTINGTLIADSPSQGSPIVFTSFAEEKQPGDWSGIVFAPDSSTIEAENASILRNCIVKYADTAITIINSDPIIDQCVIKNYLSAGGVSRNEPQTVSKYTQEDYILTNDMFNLNTPQRVRELGSENIPATFDVANTVTPSGYGECGYGYDGYGYDGYGYGYDGYGYGYGYGCGYGYNGCLGAPLTAGSIVSGAYLAYTLPLRVLTAAQPGEGSLGIPPSFPVEGNRVVLDLTYGTDYVVYLDDEDITSKAIQTFDDCTELFLIAGVDFNIEFDAITFETQLVFYNTRNMLAFLYQYAKNPRQFSITYAGIIRNGEISDSLFQTSISPAWVGQSGSDLRFINNTFYQAGSIALNFTDSYVLLRNNIIAEYTTAGVLKDPKSVVVVEHNNIYSSVILANEPHRPVDTDSLIENFEVDETVLPVRSPVKYQSGIVAKIDDEFMAIEQVGVEVRVARGSFESTPAKHDLGARVLLLRRKTFFTVTGLPAQNAQLLLTDSKGQILSTTSPIFMLALERGTFRVAVPIDRNNTVYYRYRYWNDDVGDYTETELRKLETAQFGDAVNDFFSVTISETLAVRNNYSADPQFTNEAGENFTLETSSPSSAENPIYATPWNPSIAANRFIGIIPRSEERFLTEGTKIVSLDEIPLVVDSLVESIVIRNSTSNRRILPASYNSETNEVTLVSAISLRQAGNYTVEYNSLVSLGSSLPGNPLLGTIQYQFDARRSVEFTRFTATTGGVGGLIRFAYRTSDRKDTIESQPFSDFYTVDENGIIDLQTVLPEDATPPVGSIIDFILEVQGNDGSFSNTGEYLYPKLQSFTLSYAPEIDEQPYEIKSVQYQAKTERTRVTLDPPGQVGVGILSSTAGNLSGVAEIAVNVQKFGTDTYFQLAKVRSLNVGDKFVDLLGNFTIVRTPPALGEVVETDLSYVSRSSTEVVKFVNSSTQLTSNRFVGIDSINSDIVLDRVSQTPGNEKFKIDITNQPRTGAGYNVTYDFEAPKNGETLRVSFTYNSLLADVQGSVEESKDALADVLSREMFGIPVTISANIVLAGGFSVQVVVAEVTRAVSQQYSTFVSENPFGGGRIDATDTLLVMKSVNGVDDIALTAHHKEGFTGVTNMEFSTREFPVLDATSPEITVVPASDPNTVLSVES